MSSETAMDVETAQHHHPLMSSFPVLLPEIPEVFYDRDSFTEYLKSLPLEKKSARKPTPLEMPMNTFMDALTSDEPTLPDNLMFTDNGAVTHASTKSALLDLFTELEKVISDSRLETLLTKAWAESPIDTLKLMFQARSIHVGKSDKYLFYRCMGWLKEHHPLTLLLNLEWIVRPVVQKRLPKESEEGVGDEVVIEMQDADEVDEGDITRFDVKDGASHGYYADLLNLLVLAAKDELRFGVDPPKMFFTPKTPSSQFLKRPHNRRARLEAVKKVRREAKAKKAERETLSPEEREQKRRDNMAKHQAAVEEAHKQATERQHAKEMADHAKVVKKLQEDPFYRGLHLAVARIFVHQIQRDEKILASGQNFQAISLASKWAPSLEKMHDLATCVATTMAEIMFTPESIGQQDQPREVYLKHARQHYRQHLAALRKAIDVVEVKIVAQRFKDIHYNRVPSLAMDRYKTLFATKDLERFEVYINEVAAGKTNISGAVLLPSTLVRQARDSKINHAINPVVTKKPDVNARIKAKIAELEGKVVDAQWNTLVQRIRDNGTLENAIAVVDVSGSMCGPTFSDGTTPLHTAIGLGLVIAQVAKPPFNNTFITFSMNPQVIRLDPAKGLAGLVAEMERSEWEMNTDFNAVFEKLILPMAIANKIPKEDMVKRIFVLSDMQFDNANKPTGARYRSFGIDPTPPAAVWNETSHQRIKRKFEEAGYELPEMVYWNLAGGRHGVAPKPVTQETPGTAMVSGYSQGMLKVFLDGGELGEIEEETEAELVGEDGETKTVKLKKKIDPVSIMRKAIGKPAFRMLEVVD